MNKSELIGFLGNSLRELKHFGPNLLFKNFKLVKEDHLRISMSSLWGWWLNRPPPKNFSNICNVIKHEKCNRNLFQFLLLVIFIELHWCTDPSWLGQGQTGMVRGKGAWAQPQRARSCACSHSQFFCVIQQVVDSWRQEGKNYSTLSCVSWPDKEVIWWEEVVGWWLWRISRDSVRGRPFVLGLARVREPASF